MSYLKITAIGNLGRDPELRYSQDGKPICTFSMAMSEKYKDHGEQKERTTWARVTFFGRQAEAASQYLTKGKPVYIEGRGRLEEWTDRDGKVRTTLEVNGTEMQFIAPRDDSGGRQPAQRPASNQSREYTPTALSLDDDSTPPF